MWAKTSSAGQFFGKNSYFNSIWITLSTFLEPFERTKFLRFEGQLKKSLSLLQLKSKTTRSKFCILGLNFISDSAEVRGSKVHCLLQYF